VLVAAFAALVVLGRATLPSVGRGSLSIDDHSPPAATDVPIFIRDQRRFDTSFAIEVPFFRPRRVVVVPTQCVERLAVNRVDILSPHGPCADGDRVVDISSAIRRGANRMRVVVRSQAAKATLDVGVRSGVEFAVFAFALLAVAATAVLLVLKRRRKRRPDGVLLGVLLAGTALRTLYLLATPASVRQHDWDTHLEYIDFVAKNWHLPPPHGGFEYYQPPLYYVLTALLSRAETRAGVLLSDTMFHLQIFALLLSVAALWLALWTLRVLLVRAPTRGAGGLTARRSDLVIGASLLAVFPGLVYFAGRINNDVLVQVTSFAGVALVIEFWRNGRTVTWMAFALCVTAGLLTKSNTYVVLGLGLACLAARRRTSLRRKALLGALLAATMTVLAGWFILPRFRQDPGTTGLLVANLGWLGAPTLSNTPEALFGFHPRQMLEHPYNLYNVPEAVAGRQLWQFFVRSSLFGDFDFGPRLITMSRAMLVLLALLGLVSVRGWWRSLRERPWQDFPMHALFVGSLASHLAFRVSSAYIPSQDFRYSFLIALPAAYFVTLGIQGMPRWPRRAAVAVWAAFVACSTTLIVALWVLVEP
jgi:hypothetical protein